MTPSSWPPVDSEDWSVTCDTLHAHTQVLGKLAVELAAPEPELQHTALRLTARGWESPPLPAPDGSGMIVAGLDLRSHEAVVEHSSAAEIRVPLAPDRPVADVTHDVLGAVERLAGAISINPTPQEVPWTTPLDEDRDHATYDTEQVARCRTASRTPTSTQGPRAGTRPSANSSSTGTTSARRTTLTCFALDFARSAFRHGSPICEWDPVLAESAFGEPPPIH